MIQFIPTAAAMEFFGGQLAVACDCGGIFHLCGELGVGKTTLVRGFLRGLGYSGAVKSPTYTLVEPYQVGERMVYHFDFYRLGDPEELEYMGIRDYLEDNVICLIEWPEKGGELTPAPDVQIDLSYCAEGRFLELLGLSAIGDGVVARFSAQDKSWTPN
ncbi:MAG: tRNA (adenosine(37)-N6)-threonylcarbamoyltransferase complex ATPase subunit type 1 TsaE [Pseudomonadota bacterium]